ncbi:unnamed protein product [Caenorhabditis angaria]|uniref:VWFA domain-containing protein n=1 Tax=Caenorhabditis angaria TaxID=860376 RepID=A0A9P1N737_9PELO|nr:unnamed protein product [Caenorhabditis angaria]
MNVLLLIALLPALISAYKDRECGADLSNLWLDVVVVVDNSAGMTQDGLSQVIGDVSTVLTNGTRIGTQYADPRSTRVGIVTYNSDGTIAANLDAFNSTDGLIGGMYDAIGIVSTQKLSYLETGLSQAETVLNQGRRGVRKNYKQVVIVYASAYQGTGAQDPVPAADRLKESDVAIITVAFEQEGNTDLLEPLSQIASPGFNFTSKDVDLVGEIEGALLQTNCFCPDLWFQYSADYNDLAAQRFGVCVKSAGLQASWTSAKFACQHFASNAFLVSEFSQQKHDFVFQLIKNDKTMTSPFMYHIGLSRINGVWSWQQPGGQTLPVQNYTNWNPGYPTDVSADSAALNSPTGDDLVVGWQNINPYTVAKNYVCESRACDTDNYCP